MAAANPVTRRAGKVGASSAQQQQRTPFSLRRPPQHIYGRTRCLPVRLVPCIGACSHHSSCQAPAAGALRCASTLRMAPLLHSAVAAARCVPPPPHGAALHAASRRRPRTQVARNDTPAAAHAYDALFADTRSGAGGGSGAADAAPASSLPLPHAAGAGAANAAVVTSVAPSPLPAPGAARPSTARVAAQAAAAWLALNVAVAAVRVVRRCAWRGAVRARVWACLHLALR